MSKNRLDISDNTAISMPVRNMLAIIGAVAVGVWAYFGVLERITMLETKSQLAEKDLASHVERLENDLTKVMINQQLASLGFQMTLNVRNKVLSAYKDIMNMPV